MMLQLLHVEFMVSEAMKAAETLASKGLNATVVDMHTIKPLDHDLIKNYQETVEQQ